MSGRKHDPIAIVEAAYDLAADDDAWIENLLERVAPIVDGGHGVAAFRYEWREAGRLGWSGLATSGVRGLHALALRTALRTTPRALAGRLVHARASFNAASELLGVRRFTRHPLTRALGHPNGMHDLLSLQVRGLDERGLLFLAAQRSLKTVSAGARRRWAMCSAHVAAGLRLRASVRRSDLVEAVLAADGRLLHAEGPAAEARARAELEDAGRAVDRARGRLRDTDADAALEVWRGLVDGRWSLVEQIESDGRRYMVARKNEPYVEDPRALTLRERQVAAYAARGHSTKLIAYELGLARSTVAAHLAAALRKLGARSRGDLRAQLSEEGGGKSDR